jgi:hypothetical protein
MPGPYADYWVKDINQALQTTEKTLATFNAPNVDAQQGLLQVQVHTENTIGLKAILKVNGTPIFTYGPTSTNMTRMLQAVLPVNVPNTNTKLLKATNNIIEGEVIQGSGSFTVGPMAIHWQAT